MTTRKKAGEGTVRLNAILPDEMYQRLRKVAFDEHRPLTAIIRDALDRYLKRKGGTR